MGKNEEPLSLNRYTYCYNNPIAYIDPTGFDSYIFYLEEWEKEALADKKTIESRYDSEVHLKPVKNAQDFIEEWNSMGTVNNQAVSIDTVLINTHGSDNKTIGFGNGNTFGDDDFDELQDKDMKSLVLLACTGGHLDYVGTNLASRFSQKTNGAPVMASDGTVYGRCIFGYYWSHSDDFFKNQLKEERECQGWAVYQSNKLGITQVQKVNKTLKYFGEMLDDLNKYTFGTISNKKKTDDSSKYLERWLSY